MASVVCVREEARSSTSANTASFTQCQPSGRSCSSSLTFISHQPIVQVTSSYLSTHHTWSAVTLALDSATECVCHCNVIQINRP